MIKNPSNLQQPFGKATGSAVSATAKPIPLIGASAPLVAAPAPPRIQQPSTPSKKKC